MFAKTLVALGAAAVAAAHGGVIGYEISGTYYPGYAIRAFCPLLLYKL